MSNARAAPERGTSSFLREMMSAGAAAWPSLLIDEPVVEERLTRLFSRGFVISECLHPADLFFAIGCSSGGAEALRLFEQTFMPGMLRSASHLLTAGVRPDDFRQALRVKLLVNDEASEAKITQYTGRGPLAGWLRIVAVRTVVSLRRGKEPSAPRDEEDELLGNLAAHGADAELEHLRARYKVAFQTAFHDALMSLDVAERNLLRLHHVEGLGIDDIAPVFQIHRATAARRLTKAREEISTRTRSLLVSRMHLTESECSSIMGMILSQLDVSIVRVLSTREE